MRSQPTSVHNGEIANCFAAQVCAPHARTRTQTIQWIVVFVTGILLRRKMTTELVQS